MEARSGCAWKKSVKSHRAPARDLHTLSDEATLQAHGRNGEHRQKLRVDFRPVVSFKVPIKTGAGLTVALVSPPGEVQTPPGNQDAPQAKEEALP